MFLFKDEANIDLVISSRILPHDNGNENAFYGDLLMIVHDACDGYDGMKISLVYF